jgi:hypothetical protein
VPHFRLKLEPKITVFMGESVEYRVETEMENAKEFNKRFRIGG